MTITVERFHRDSGGDHYAVRTTECNVCGKRIAYGVEGAHHNMASHLKQSESCRRAYNRFLESSMARRGVDVDALAVHPGVNEA